MLNDSLNTYQHNILKKLLPLFVCDVLSLDFEFTTTLTTFKRRMELYRNDFKFIFRIFQSALVWINHKQYLLKLLQYRVVLLKQLCDRRTSVTLACKDMTSHTLLTATRSAKFGITSWISVNHTAYCAQNFGMIILRDYGAVVSS